MRGVRVEHAEAAECLDGLEEVSTGADRGVDVEPVRHAGPVVVGAVAGRRVDGAGSLVERDVGGQHAHRLPVVQGMAEPDPSSCRPGNRATGAPNGRPTSADTRAASPSATITTRSPTG